MQFKTLGNHPYRFIATFHFSLAAILLTAGMTMSAFAQQPGDLDPTFGYGGRIPPPGGLPAQSAAFGVVVQPDQKILVLGTDQHRIVLTRFLPNGTFDPAFGTGGRVYAELDNVYGNPESTDLALQPDGKIIVTATHRLNNWAVINAYAFRFLPDGSLDPTFDGDGKLPIRSGIPGLSFATTSCKAAVQSDGKIVLSCGEWLWEEDYWKVILRLNPNGSIDTTFGDGIGGPGRVYLDTGDFFPLDIAIQPDGKIVGAGGYNLTAGVSIGLVRLNTDGSYDGSFGDSGWVFTSSGGFALNERAVAIQPDKKIVVAGSYDDSPTWGGLVIRYLPNGSLDTSFGGSGMIFSSPGSGYYESLAIQSNGKVVAGGWSPNGHIVARFLANGALDQTFGTNGHIVTDFPNLSLEGIIGGGIAGLAIQADGKIIGAGNWAAPRSYPLDDFWSYQAIARYIGDSRAAYDFDGDGRADISVFRPSDRVWYLDQSTAGFSATQFGLSTDKITPADYDGDGKTDISVYRDGTWYLLRSTAGFAAAQFGLAGDIPVPADFTGDGRAELAVYRGGTWWTYDLSNGQTQAIQFGLATDKPVVADYDGDGRNDQAVYRDGVWHLNRSSQGYAAIQFGLATDKLVPADYDGDGKTDLAVYRDGIWYRLQSTTGFTAFQFGIATDTPAPADYDGDGKTDAAVYRNGAWWILQSTSGISVQQFGLAGDKPVPAAFVP